MTGQILDFFGPTPFLIFDGSPNDQLLTIYQSTSLPACSPSQDLGLNLMQLSIRRVHDGTESANQFLGAVNHSLASGIVQNTSLDRMPLLDMPWSILAHCYGPIFLEQFY